MKCVKCRLYEYNPNSPFGVKQKIARLPDSIIADNAPARSAIGVMEKLSNIPDSCSPEIIRQTNDRYIARYKMETSYKPITKIIDLYAPADSHVVIPHVVNQRKRYASLSSR